MEKILIIVDMQKDFIDGTLGTKEAQEIVPAVKEKNMTVVKEKAKESLLAKLQRNKELVKKDGDSDKKIKQKNMER